MAKFCTQSANGAVARCDTLPGPSRLDYFDNLGADHTDHAIDKAVLTYVHGRALTGAVVSFWASQLRTRSGDDALQRSHFECLGVTGFRQPVWLPTPDDAIVPYLPDFLRCCDPAERRDSRSGYFPGNRSRQYEPSE
jgi:hypothetical protein